MDNRRRRTGQRLTVELPFELVEELTDAAGLSHKTMNQFIEDVLASEMARWRSGFPLPQPPEDFRRALDGQPEAAAFLATAGRRDHHRILAWIDEAKRPDTRARRIEEAIALLLRGRIPHRR
ncbi:YdeI/OmpD-associated family protein [Actinoplanes campanulatus]|nr:YdeI/OmpD-associated family protein [Actinoplanes capillaceus]